VKYEKTVASSTGKALKPAVAHHLSKSSSENRRFRSVPFDFPANTLERVGADASKGSPASIILRSTPLEGPRRRRRGSHASIAATRSESMETARSAAAAGDKEAEAAAEEPGSEEHASERAFFAGGSS